MTLFSERCMHAMYICNLWSVSKVRRRLWWKLWMFLFLNPTYITSTYIPLSVETFHIRTSQIKNQMRSPSWRGSEEIEEKKRGLRNAKKKLWDGRQILLEKKTSQTSALELWKQTSDDGFLFVLLLTPNGMINYCKSLTFIHNE